MPHRMIKSRTRTSSMHLTACLASLFALELMNPSPRLYLLSPWVSNMPLLPNRAGQYRGLAPTATTSYLTLAHILEILADRGVQVHIITRTGVESSATFLRSLPASILKRSSPDLHEKGLITDRFYLRGSMNFTYSGVNINEEHVELSTDQETVSRAILAAQQYWEDLAA